VTKQCSVAFVYWVLSKMATLLRSMHVQTLISDAMSKWLSPDDVSDLAQVKNDPPCADLVLQNNSCNHEQSVGPQVLEQIHSSRNEPHSVAGGDIRVWTSQHIGNRPNQEDRFVVAPKLMEQSNPSPCSMFGVFDGTVGDFASEVASTLFVPTLLQSSSWDSLRDAQTSDFQTQKRLLEKTMHETYNAVDAAVLARCAEKSLDFATSTACTLMVTGDLLTIAHLGDSRLIVAVEDVPSKCQSDSGTRLLAVQMTKDHKPNSASEMRRIQHCGGKVVRLGKRSERIFIRGADFEARADAGEKPYQLSYSRAFGARGLKHYGVSSVPDITVVDRSSRRVRWAIIASDGLWNVVSAQEAVDISQEARQIGHDPSEALVQRALRKCKDSGARADNVTAVCVQFND